MESINNCFFFGLAQETFTKPTSQFFSPFCLGSAFLFLRLRSRRTCVRTGLAPAIRRPTASYSVTFDPTWGSSLASFLRVVRSWWKAESSFLVAGTVDGDPCWRRCQTAERVDKSQSTTKSWTSYIGERFKSIVRHTCTIQNVIVTKYLEFLGDNCSRFGFYLRFLSFLYIFSYIQRKIFFF